MEVCNQKPETTGGHANVVIEELRNGIFHSITSHKVTKQLFKNVTHCPNYDITKYFDVGQEIIGHNLTYNTTSFV